MSVLCNSCNFSVSSESRLTHYQSEWHRYNIKRKCAGLPSVTEEEFKEKLAVLQKQKSVGIIENTSQSCTMCNQTFRSVSAYKSHLTSKKHQKRQAKKQSSEESTRSEESARSEESTRSEEPSDESKTVKPEKEAPKAISLKHCLFCSSSSGYKSVKLCLSHMLKQHGFFIPFVEYITDLHGLLQYLGKKINEGCICIWCNKAKESAYACRQHMIAKNHCKIRLESGEDEEEFMAFYRFPGEDEEETTTEKKDKRKAKEEKEHEEEEEDEEEEEGEEKDDVDGKALVPQKDGSMAVIKHTAPARSLAGVNDVGELVLTDGSTIGHRSLWKYYKQNVRAGDTRESVLLAQMEQQSLALKLPGSQVKKEKKAMVAADRAAARFQKDRLAQGMTNNLVSLLRYRERNQIII